MNRVLLKPLITEKLTRLQDQENKYAFEVARNATKPQIKKAIEEAYPEVTVTKVNTMITPSKPKGRYTRAGYLSGRTKIRKKAVVSVKEGQEIDFFSEI